MKSNHKSAQRLRQAAAAKNADVLKRLTDAMSDIEDEIKQAGGIYPGGKLNQAVLCERAGVWQSTLQKSTHKSSTLPMVNRWLTQVAAGLRSKREAKKSTSDKIALLHEEARQVKQQYHESELELIDARERIVQLQEKIEQLQTQLAALSTRDSQILSFIDAKRKAKERKA